MRKKGIARFTAFCMAAGLTVGGTSMVSIAAPSDKVLVGVGTVSKTAEKQVTTEAVTTGEMEAAEVEEEFVPDESVVGTTGFASCEEYINIRSSADKGGKVVGKLYHNAMVNIEGVDEHGWYKVTSGNIEGYVAAQYIVTGEAADTLASQVGYHVAEVGAETLNVRAAADNDSDVVTTVTEAQEIEIVEDCGEWLKVAVAADCYGYVSADYVDAQMQYKLAVPVEEEVVEEPVYTEPVYTEDGYYYEEPVYTESYYYEEPAYTETYYYEEPVYVDYSYADDAQAAADIAYQEYIDAQAAADDAAQYADEDAAYQAAEEAQIAYQEYVDAQTTADEAYEEISYYEEQYTEPDYSETYTDDSYSYTEPTYDEYTTDGSYVDDTTYEDLGDTTSGGTLGNDIVNFATQFVGNPYVWGGTSLTDGADCSGFVQSVMANFGISTPRTAADQSYGGSSVSLDDIQAGDLLFYGDGGDIGHVSIYMGNGQVVHASTSSTGIIISDYGYRQPVSASRYW